MRRSRRVLVLCHCLLNANAKVFPLALVPGVYQEVLDPYLRQGVGFVQLPCPELSYLGLNRWGMTREQYDHPNFRAHCGTILRPVVHQLQAMAAGGIQVLGVVGMDGSPNCGVNFTCSGYQGGELDHRSVLAQIENLTWIPGKGVFFEILDEALRKTGLCLPFGALKESEGDTTAILWDKESCNENSSACLDFSSRNMPLCDPRARG